MNLETYLTFLDSSSRLCSMPSGRDDNGRFKPLSFSSTDSIVFRISIAYSCQRPLVTRLKETFFFFFFFNEMRSRLLSLFKNKKK